MSEWERDPEGETLRMLASQVPRLPAAIEAALAMRAERPCMMFALYTLSETDLWTLAYAYNNLMALYERGRARKVAPDRFLRDAPEAPPAANAACTLHSAEYLARATQRQMVAWKNAWTLTHDREHAYLPHDEKLRNTMQVFESYVRFYETLRVAEIIGHDGGQVVIVDRMFANVMQYRRYVEAYDRALGRRQMAARRRLGCPECCPCVATAALCMYPRDDMFRLPYVWEESEKVLAPWFDKDRAIWTDKTRRCKLARIHNAVLWFFSGTRNPLDTFFRVAAGLLQPGDTDVGIAVGLVQEVATLAFIFFWDHPATARLKQERFVQPELALGRLFDPLAARLVNSCRPAS